MICAIGQDSHRFMEPSETCDTNIDKPLLLGGVLFEDAPPLSGNSDADVVLHALCNAISGITCVNILGSRADNMLKERGIVNSEHYVLEAMKYLDRYKIAHLSFSIECAVPKISPRIEEMRINIARITGVPSEHIGITATSGEALTDFGRGLGIQVFCMISCFEMKDDKLI